MRMPVSRDISVKKEAKPQDEGHAIASSKASPGLVTVMGFDKSDVLFRSNDVGTVQWRDSKGDIVAILVRLRPDIWGFSKRGDEDWEANLAIYGNPDAT